MRHFLSELDLTQEEFLSIIRRGSEFRQAFEKGITEALLPRRVLGMIFEKSSTRTRVSFEAGMTQLGGHAIYLSPNDTQLGRGETLTDTANVLSQMLDIVMVRTFSHEALEQFTQSCTIPVINGLTDLLHPCQLLADMQTYADYRGSIEGKTVAYVGDGNNMCHSYMNTAALLNFQLRIACPEKYSPEAAIRSSTQANIEYCHSPMDACDGADLVVTDVWSSMGQEAEQAEREQAFQNYCITEQHMAAAHKDALFMHCLPAHRGEEVSAEVIDGPQSVVWDEAGNRLHSQKALIEFLLK
ncbi:MAG: ornithine carbamoyltransferase [Gammaproteobacteria bacterium]|nr:ornithine carbamoyltransferase [Gammaproteobacteria bacterium]